jgi:hypothetical protein
LTHVNPWAYAGLVSNARQEVPKVATQKQLYWVEKLVGDPRLTPAVRAQARHVLAHPAENPADLLGVMFKLCPKEPSKHAVGKPAWDGTKPATVKASNTPDAFKVFGSEFPGIIPGYYAVPNPNGTNDLTFFNVRFGKQFSKLPSMADRVFVKRVVGGHPEMKCEPAEARKLLALVSDVKAARALYGQELGHCGNCNKELTDQVSRDRGYGPDCWAVL